MNKYGAVIFILINTGVFFSGCSSNQQIREETTPKNTLSSYCGILWAGFDNIKIFDAAKGIDSIIITNVKQMPFTSSISPNRKLLAIGYKVENDFYVDVLDTRTLKIKTIHSKQIKTSLSQVNFAWSNNSDSLFFNYWQVRNKVGENVGSLLYLTEMDTLVSFRVKNGAKIESYINPGYVVMSYEHTYYVINPRTGNPIYTINDLDQPLFSPDGRKILFYRSVLTIDEYGNEKRMRELYLSDISGRNQKKIAGYVSRPSKAQWLANSKSIVLELQSQKYSNKTYVAFYDIESKEISYSKSQDEAGVTTENPSLSPSKNKLLSIQRMQYENAYGGRSSDVFLILSNLETNETKILNQGRNDFSDNTRNIPIGSFNWIDDNMVVVGGNNWTTLYDIKYGAVTIIAKSSDLSLA